MKPFAIIAALGAVMFASAAAQEVEQVTVGEATDYGIRYSLPQTELRVSVTATCTTVKAGQFAAFAEKLLGIVDAPQEDLTTWEVSDLKLDAVAVADTSRMYHITFSGGAMPTFYLTKDGMLWSINRGPDQVRQAAPPAVPAKAAVRKPVVMTEEMLRAGSKAKQAEVMARQIFRIRESRMDLLTGEADNVPKDGAAYQLVMDNLDAQEQACLEYFTGESVTTTQTRTYTYVPTGDVKDHVLFRFSQHYGLLDADDLSGRPYTLAVKVTEDNREVPQPVDGKKKKSPVLMGFASGKGGQGIAYLLPGKAHVSVLQGRTLVAEADYTMGQLGRVERLQSSYFTDKKRAASAEFNPQTGAIRIYE